MTKSSAPSRNLLPANSWTVQQVLSWIIFGVDTVQMFELNTTSCRLLPVGRTYAWARRELRDAISRGEAEARGFSVLANSTALTREVLPPDLFQQFPVAGR